MGLIFLGMEDHLSCSQHVVNTYLCAEPLSPRFDFPRLENSFSWSAVSFIAGPAGNVSMVSFRRNFLANIFLQLKFKLHKIFFKFSRVKQTMMGLD